MFNYCIDNHLLSWGEDLALCRNQTKAESM